MSWSDFNVITPSNVVHNCINEVNRFKPVNPRERKTITLIFVRDPGPRFALEIIRGNTKGTGTRRARGNERAHDKVDFHSFTHTPFTCFACLIRSEVARRHASAVTNV